MMTHDQIHKFNKEFENLNNPIMALNESIVASNESIVIEQATFSRAQNTDFCPYATATPEANLWHLIRYRDAPQNQTPERKARTKTAKQAAALFIDRMAS